MATKPKLNPDQLAILSAILGISNAGMDAIFLPGSQQVVTPEDVQDLYTAPRRYKPELTVDDAVMSFGRSFFESENMADTFKDEAKFWFQRLKGLTTATVEKRWFNDEARWKPFFDAIVSKPAT